MHIEPAIAKPHPFHVTTGLYIRLLWVWTLCSTAAVCTIISLSGKPVARAVVCMGTGLVLFWVWFGGLLMRRYRDSVRSVVLRIPGCWSVKFVLFCTLLACIEEAITTTMTNLAPIFGVRIGQAYITASANYFDVIFFHSVIVLVPMFVCWAVMLSRWDFSPHAVFLLYGLSGAIAEMQFGGFGQYAEYGMWTFVYGLMVYLPAYSLPRDRGASPAPWWAYPATILLPGVFIAPVALAMKLLFHHPNIDFPPIVPNT